LTITAAHFCTGGKRTDRLDRGLDADGTRLAIQ
jgi:hypothetical protein